jgi:prevent-host-death family protein
MVIDHGKISFRRRAMEAMEEIAISKFKATCLAVLQRVQTTGRPVRVTKFGKPVAEVVPPTPSRGAKRQMGLMAGTAEILGDIISPAVAAEQWEAIGGRKNRRER